MVAIFEPHWQVTLAKVPLFGMGRRIHFPNTPLYAEKKMELIGRNVIHLKAINKKFSPTNYSDLIREYIYLTKSELNWNATEPSARKTAKETMAMYPK